jgi:hypothetical protein
MCICGWVNAQLSGSKMAKIIVSMSPNKILLNDLNGHGCFFFKCYDFNIWIIHVQSPTNLPKSTWKFIFDVIWIMTHLKFSKNMLLGGKNEKKLQFIWTYENMVKFEPFKSF